MPPFTSGATMAKLTLSNVTNISGAESVALGVINANSDAIETALENTLSRDGTTPNSMGADLDMDNNDILNVGSLNANTLIIDGVVVTTEETFYETGSEAGVQSFRYDFNTVTLLLADTVRTYSNTTAGDYIRTRSEGFAYKVATSGATDHHVTTGGGLKLYVLPNEKMSLNVAAFNPDGTNDHATIIVAAEALDALGGGILDIPEGLYDIGTGGVLLSGLTNVHVRGAGGKATQFKKAAGFTGTAALIFSECSNCSAKGIYVNSNNEDGNGIAAGPANFNTFAGTNSSEIHVSECHVELQPDEHNYGIFFLNVDGGSIFNNVVDGMTETPWLNNEMEGIECFGGTNVRVIGNKIKNISGNAISLFSSVNLPAPFKNIVYAYNQVEECFGFIWATASFGSSYLNSMLNVSLIGNQGRKIYQRGVSGNIVAEPGVTASDYVIDGMLIANNQVDFSTSAEGAVSGSTSAFGFSAALSTSGVADISKFECRNVVHTGNIYDGIDNGAASLASIGPMKALNSHHNKYRRKDSTGTVGAYLYNAKDCTIERDVFEKSQNYAVLVEQDCTNLALIGNEFIDMDQASAGTVQILFNSGSSSTGVRVHDNIWRRPTGTWSTSTLVAFSSGSAHPQQSVSGNRYYGTVNVADEVGFVGSLPANANRGTFTMSGGATSFTINTTACTGSSMVVVNQTSGTTQNVTRIDPTTGSFTAYLAAATDGSIYSWRVI